MFDISLHNQETVGSNCGLSRGNEDTRIEFQPDRDLVSARIHSAAATRVPLFRI
jgi:hypothetical protein